MDAKQTRSLLLTVLEDSGVVWQEDAGLVRFRIAREGMSWEMACRCEAGQILCYGRYPFAVPDRGVCLERCSRINSRAESGAMFLPRDGCPVFRTTARLDDPYGARHRLIRALEYNAAVIARFWGQLSGR